MFEPLNALEQALIAAVADPGARAAFTRMMLETELYVAQQSEHIPLGHVVASVLEQGDTPCVFTARERIAEAVGPVATVRSMRGRALFETLRTSGAHLNPGLDHSVVYSPKDVDQILDSVADQLGARTEQLLVARPKQAPEALVRALSAALAAHKGVRGAWLMAAKRASETEPTWLVGVDIDGPWAPISAAIRKVAATADLGDRILTATEVKDDTLGRALRGGIPIFEPHTSILPSRLPE